MARLLSLSLYKELMKLLSLPLPTFDTTAIPPSQIKQLTNLLSLPLYKPGNKNKGKGNGAGLACESQTHCFADEFPFTHAHSFGTDT